MKTYKIIIEKANTNLFSWYYAWLSFCDERVKDFCGDYLSESFIEIKNDYGRMGSDLEKFNNLGKAILESIKNGKISYSYLKENSLRIGEKILRLCNEILSKKLSSLTNENLINNIKKLCKLSGELIFLGVIPVFSDFYHLTLTNELKRIVRLKKQQYNLKISEQAYINALITPTEENIFKKENIEFLEIANTAKEKRIKFKNKGKLKRACPEIYNMIVNHTKKYCWINYDYQGPAYDEDYFIGALKEALNKFKDPKNEIKKIKNAQKKLEEKQDIFLRGLRLEKNEKLIFDTAKEFLFLKRHRLGIRYRAHYVFDTLFGELSKRIGLTLEELRYMRIQEFGNIEEINRKELKDRRRYCVCYRKGHEEKLLLGKEAKKYVNNILIEDDVREVQQIEGESACLGKVRGIVKIINSINDMKKMEKGNILVSIATNPNLLPAMKKAAAIVTDMGGLTAHATIIAREMAIPCITGTKMATKVLKDGNFVEVDANEGIIRLLKRE